MKFGHFSQLFNKRGMTPHARYEQMWRELELADEVGFDFGFQSVHHSHKLRPTPSMFCAGGAARTKRLRLGPMGYITGLHHPLRIVEEAFLLDNILNGRFELGLVYGVYPEYFRVYGEDAQQRRLMGRETVSLLKAAYRTKAGELLSFRGDLLQVEEVELAIRPVQKPGPPIWLTSTQIETLRFMAAEGDHGGYLHFHDRSEMSPRMRDYVRWWRDAGHQGTPNIGYLTFVYVDETDEAALRKAAPWIIESNERIYENSPRRGGSFAETEEMVGPKSLEIYKNKHDIGYLLDRDLVFVGSPETVARKIKNAAQEGCFNTLFGEFNIGTVEEDDLMRSIRLFGTQVIPALQGFDPAA